MRRSRTEPLDRGVVLGVLFLLLALVAVTLPELGSNPWPFKPPSVDPSGPLAPLVRAAGEEWDVGIARSFCLLAGLFVALVATRTLRRPRLGRGTTIALITVVALALSLPAGLLSIGLREATSPWLFTNDSTYQIELAGDLLLDGQNPYGHDFRRSGMERFYTFDGSASERVREREVALRHFAYFPGTAVTAAAWRAVIPAPADDLRILILLFTLAGLAAALAFRGPPGWKLAIGAMVVANPIAVRSVWFGQNDAPSLTLCLLAFALVTRGRYRWAVATLAGAVLLKQFAVVAIPFIALMLLGKGLPRKELGKIASVFGCVLAVFILPFLIADPVAFWEDTVVYGAGTYKIVGYGLSGLMVRAGIVDGRNGDYPFALIALLTWLPLTLWLLWAQFKGREQWLGPAGFAISLTVLLFIGRTFNNYYLVWPLTGAAAAVLTYVGTAFSASSSRGPSQPGAASEPSAPACA